MEKKKNTQILIIVLLSVAILFMSVGYATFASQLNIAGTATVKANRWSVHYVTDSYSESTNSVQASAHNITATDFTFTATLTKPGDFYEATANVINDGTFNAQLSSLTMSTLTAAQQKYITYKVYFDGVEYSASATGLSQSLPYATGTNTKVVKVRAQYIQPENSADLPTAQDDSVTLTASLNFTQVS